MRISEVATRAGVNIQTVRYYERRGLLRQPERLDSGYRSFDMDAVRTIRFIRRAQELGFSLDRVASLLDLAAGGPENCDAARELAEERLDELERRIRDLSAMRDALRQLAATCEESKDRRSCPLLKAMGGDMPHA